MSAGDRGSAAGMEGRRAGSIPPLETWLLVAAVLLVNVLTVMSMSRYGVFMLFAPAILLFFPFFALRVLSNPIQVFCIFLVLIVNLDFFRIRETRLTADILTSSMVLYAVLVRLLLSGRMAVRGPVAKAYMIYLGLTFMSVVLSVSVPASVKNWGRDLEYWIFFLFLSSVAMTGMDRRSVAKAVMLSSIIPCLLGLAGMIFQIDALYGQETPIAGGEEVRRISATLSHPVTLSHFLAFTGVFTLSMLVDGKWFRRAALIPLFVLQMTILYLTYGRTGWGEMAAAVIALFLMHGKRKVVFVGLPTIVLTLFAVVPGFLGRIENAFQSGDNSLLWRMGLWVYALGKFPQKPIFGSGQDTFANYIAYDTGFAAHHTWINMLIETGILGFVGFLVLQIVVGRSLEKMRRDPAHSRDPLLIGVYCGWIGMLVGSMAGDPFNLPAISVYLWTLLAVALRSKSFPGKAVG